MADVWHHVELSGLPPCDGETVFVGINSVGYPCCFNAVNSKRTCFMVTDESMPLMSDLRWWRVLDQPAVAGVTACSTPSADEPSR